MDESELRAQFRMQKRAVRKDKKDMMREKRLAIEREEILQKLTNNKPIKLHSRGDDSNRMKDIKLENVSMTLGSLGLLTDINITFADGRKYGLVGRNGIGKTTFLKVHIHHLDTF
jgi:ATP-binding cassette subfamily F protein 3